MEDRRDNQAGRLVLITLALLALTAPARSQEPPTGPFEPWNPTIDVSSGSDAVMVESEVRGGLPGATGVQASGGGSNCWLEPTNIGVSLAQQFWDRGGDELPFFLWCDGQMVGLVWRTVGRGSGPAPVSPEEIAMSLRDTIPIPKVTIQVNPERGLVRVESWFWIEGYDGEPITESSDAFGRLVDVEAQVQRYRWAFGDGMGLTTESPGHPYPERSEIAHVYERSSRGHEMGYPVEVAFFFSVRYRVDGGGWIDLPGIERVAQGRYPVRESQAVVRI